VAMGLVVMVSTHNAVVDMPFVFFCSHANINKKLDTANKDAGSAIGQLEI